MVRPKPPLPALEGLFGRPTVINNVLSLATVPMVLADGPEAYQALGTGRSRGTQVFQLAGNIARGGIVETAFGLTLAELVEDFGGGTRSGRPLRAVQLGGPLGAYLPAASIVPPALTMASARRMAPGMPSGPGVKTRLAPKAASTRRRSMLMVSGMVRVSL